MLPQPSFLHEVALQALTGILTKLKSYHCALALAQKIPCGRLIYTRAEEISFSEFGEHTLAPILLPFLPFKNWFPYLSFLHLFKLLVANNIIRFSYTEKEGKY